MIRVAALIVAVVLIFSFIPTSTANAQYFNTIIVHNKVYYDSGGVAGCFTFTKTKLQDTLAIPGKYVLATDKVLCLPQDTLTTGPVYAYCKTDTIIFRRNRQSLTAGDSALVVCWLRYKFWKTGY